MLMETWPFLSTRLYSEDEIEDDWGPGHATRLGWPRPRHAWGVARADSWVGGVIISGYWMTRLGLGPGGGQKGRGAAESPASKAGEGLVSDAMV